MHLAWLQNDTLIAYKAPEVQATVIYKDAFRYVHF